MNAAEHIVQSRQSFTMLRWAPVTAAAVLPFTFSHGWVPMRELVELVPIAGLWLFSMLMYWRTRRPLWSGIAFCSVLLLPRFFRAMNEPALPYSQAIQWLCLVIGVAGLPLLVFRGPLLRFARLDQPIAK